jgi:hypothetical protein
LPIRHEAADRLVHLVEELATGFLARLGTRQVAMERSAALAARRRDDMVLQVLLRPVEPEGVVHVARQITQIDLGRAADGGLDQSNRMLTQRQHVETLDGDERGQEGLHPEPFPDHGGFPERPPNLIGSEEVRSRKQRQAIILMPPES